MPRWRKVHDTFATPDQPHVSAEKKKKALSAALKDREYIWSEWCL